MGGDRLVTTVAGQSVEDRHGDDIRDAWREEYERLVTEVRPFDGATGLLASVVDRGMTVVLASSGPAEHVEHYVDLLGARDLPETWPRTGRPPSDADDADESLQRIWSRSR